VALFVKRHAGPIVEKVSEEIRAAARTGLKPAGCACQNIFRV
jgi:hypothetical protein